MNFVSSLKAVAKVVDDVTKTVVDVAAAVDAVATSATAVVDAANSVGSPKSSAICSDSSSDRRWRSCPRRPPVGRDRTEKTRTVGGSRKEVRQRKGGAKKC